MGTIPDSMVKCGPVYLIYSVGRAKMPDGQEMVVLIIDHQAGRDIHHLPLEHALKLSQLLQNTAVLAGAPASPVTPPGPLQGVLPFHFGRPAR